MCLVVYAQDAVPGYRVVLAANRDEYHARPAQALHWWAHEPPLLAGRDQRAGGTWLGVRRDGRFACVLNGGGAAPSADAPSRGQLVPQVLAGADLMGARQRVEREGSRFAGFHLLAGELGAGHYITNTGDGAPSASMACARSRAALCWRCWAIRRHPLMTVATRAPSSWPVVTSGRGARPWCGGVKTTPSRWSSAASMRAALPSAKRIGRGQPVSPGWPAHDTGSHRWAGTLAMPVGPGLGTGAPEGGRRSHYGHHRGRRRGLARQCPCLSAHRRADRALGRRARSPGIHCSSAAQSRTRRDRAGAQAVRLLRAHYRRRAGGGRRRLAGALPDRAG
ncbi:MAG: hypothetical protein BRD57_06405 [Proteobacteria bacterium SW_6_67_9]|nr:MAG: hypothetical protein BRD57_06405 [Proteobacteria bacterium SW_6_67_9]